MEDLRLWQRLLELPGVGELDFSGDIRPHIEGEILQEKFNEQLEYLGKKLQDENVELLRLWKTKEAEIKSKKAKKEAKKQAK